MFEPDGAVARLLRQEIASYGPVSFARFMEAALYTPEIGYYRNGRDPFGSSGDFYTAEQIPVFAESVAHFLRTSGAARVIELGAGRRELASALAEWNYLGIDLDSGELPESFDGVVLANEFFDALPVRLLRKKQTGWHELLVTWFDQFAWIEAPGSQSSLAYARNFGAQIPEGGLLEVPIRMEYWVARLAASLGPGSSILVIDYGYKAEELLRFPLGSLMSYRMHRSYEDVLSAPGTRDITAHVNFSELSRLACAYGFVVEQDTSLRNWMLTLWDTDEFHRTWQSASLQWKLGWKKLAIEMGEIFRVLILRKAMDGQK